VVGPWQPLADYLDVEVAVVVSLTWAGRTWRLSTRDLDGDDMHADVGLVEQPDVTQEISLEPGGDSAITIPVGLVLPAVDVSDYVAIGYDLDDAEVEVALVWHRGGSVLHAWAARDVIAEGLLTDGEWGDPTLPVGTITGTVEDSPYRQVRPVAALTWEVTADTWPGSPEIGARYPLVIGAPELDELNALGPQAPVVEQGAGPRNDTVLVSIGWCVATQIYLTSSSGSAVLVSISYQADGLGQLCAIADISGESTAFRADGNTYTSAWISTVLPWTPAPALRPFGGVTPLHVAAYLLSLGGADIDLAEWLTLASLVGLGVAGWVDDPDSEPWEVARDLLSGLPVTTRRSRDGWGPVILDPHIGARMAASTWRETGPRRRTSAWSQTGTIGVVRTEAEAVEGHRLESYTATIGTGSAIDGPLPHAWVRDRDHPSESSQSLSWCWSATTAWRTADWQARSKALGWEVSSWAMPAQWGREAPGDWVYLADDDTHALVLRRTLSGGIWDYTLVRLRGVIS